MIDDEGDTPGEKQKQLALMEKISRNFSFLIMS